MWMLSSTIRALNGPPAPRCTAKTGGSPAEDALRRMRIGPPCSTGRPEALLYPSRTSESTQRVEVFRFRSLAKQGIDLASMHAEAHEHAVIDHDGRHTESAQTIEQIEARVGVSPYVAHVDGRASRLEKGERGFTVGVALHRK